MRPIKFESEVTDVRQISPEVRSLKFSIPKEFEFNAGQFVSVIVDMNGEEQRRPYSVCSKDENSIEICLDLIKNGRVSPHIYNMKKGDKATIQGPMGTFLLKDNANEKENIFISTGTGIAPFVSMIKSLLEKTDKKVTLLAGYKFEKNILYDDYFKKLKEKHPNFEYRIAVSRDEDFRGDKGRVQILLEKYVPSEFSGDFYLCGIFNMIKDTGIILTTERKVLKDRIIFERYD